MSEEWEPARWWRVVAPDGTLWAETSDEAEARGRVREGDTLQRLERRVRTEHRWVSDPPARTYVVAESMRHAQAQCRELGIATSNAISWLLLDRLQGLRPGSRVIVLERPTGAYGNQTLRTLEMSGIEVEWR